MSLRNPDLQGCIDLGEDIGYENTLRRLLYCLTRVSPFSLHFIAALLARLCSNFWEDLLSRSLKFCDRDLASRCLAFGLAVDLLSTHVQRLLARLCHVLHFGFHGYTYLSITENLSRTVALFRFQSPLTILLLRLFVQPNTR